MPPRQMHADEVATDAALVRRLLAQQFPWWADRAIERVASAGTDNAIYRVGEDLAVRLPRRPSATAQAEKEDRWLPRLAPHLPLAIPEPIALGQPGEGCPWTWAVCRWLPGRSALVAAFAEPERAALTLAGFVRALQRIDTTGGPPPGPQNFRRGEPLANRDAAVRKSLAALLPDDRIDILAVTAAWEFALAAPAWAGEPVWLHGDLAPGNLLVHEGELHAVIDFGCLGVGDPACDLMAAWSVFDPDAREVFRAALDADEATWTRGRGWALTCVSALPYYRDTNPVIVATARRTIEAVLADGSR